MDRQTRLVDKESRLGIPLVLPHRFLIEVYFLFVFLFFFVFFVFLYYLSCICFILFYFIFFLCNLFSFRNMIVNVVINKRVLS